MHYFCHRSGQARPSQSKGLRLMKSQGSCKTGRTCLSFMTVTRDNSAESPASITLNVAYQRNHYGHEPDVAHLKMTEEERASIADDLSRGVPMSTILKKISKSRAGKMTPLDLIDRKHLHNIKKQFSLQGSERCHENDATSVHIWVKAMADKQETVVRFYKQQGSDMPGSSTFAKEDFALVLMTEAQEDLLKELGSGTVCIDSTHGTTGYDFQVTTLLVLDEYGSGLPVAYMISNRTNTPTMQAFFESLKSTTGEVHAAYFMSDDAQEYYKAWSSVMGKPKNKLLCIWHVDKNWRNKILSLIKGRQQQVDAYMNLRMLMECTSTAELDELIDLFLSSGDPSQPELQDLLAYFKENYADRREEWALSYRLPDGVSTNMHLERMHGTLKHSVLEGKKNKRVDKLISALFDLTHHFLRKRVVHIVKDKRTCKMARIEKSHRPAEAIKKFVVAKKNGTWSVESQRTTGLSHTVSKEADGACCPLACSTCAICVHTYKCTCYEHMIHHTICKHIHAVQMVHAPEMQEKMPLDSPSEEESKASRAQSLLDSIGKTQASISITRSAEVLACIDTIKGYEEEGAVHPEVTKKVSKMLKKVVGLYEGEKKRAFADETKEPANKNIEHQVRFHSTKKPRLSGPTTTLSKPTELQKEMLKARLLHMNVESNEIITTSGHEYC